MSLSVNIQPWSQYDIQQWQVVVMLMVDHDTPYAQMTFYLHLCHWIIEINKVNLYEYPILLESPRTRTYANMSIDLIIKTKLLLTINVGMSPFVPIQLSIWTIIIIFLQSKKHNLKNILYLLIKKGIQIHTQSEKKWNEKIWQLEFP